MNVVCYVQTVQIEKTSTLSLSQYDAKWEWEQQTYPSFGTQFVIFCLLDVVCYRQDLCLRLQMGVKQLHGHETFSPVGAVYFLEKLVPCTLVEAVQVEYQTFFHVGFVHLSLVDLQMEVMLPHGHETFVVVHLQNWTGVYLQTSDSFAIANFCKVEQVLSLFLLVDVRQPHDHEHFDHFRAEYDEHNFSLERVIDERGDFAMSHTEIHAVLKS